MSFNWQPLVSCWLALISMHPTYHGEVLRSNSDLAGNEDSRRSCVSHTSQILWRHGSVGVLDDGPISRVSQPRFQANMVVGDLAWLRFSMGAGCTANLCFCFVSCVIALWKNNHVFDGQWCIFADASVFLSCFCFFLSFLCALQSWKEITCQKPP